VLNQKTVSMFHLYINNLFHHGANEISVYEIWQKLKSMYERKTKMNKALVIKILENFE
jgi:hypothetical protein